MQDLLPLIQTGGLIALLALGFVMGKLAESRHYRSIREREQRFVGIPTVSLRTLSAIHARSPWRPARWSSPSTTTSGS